MHMHAGVGIDTCLTENIIWKIAFGRPNDTQTEFIEHYRDPSSFVSLVIVEYEHAGRNRVDNVHYNHHQCICVRRLRAIELVTAMRYWSSSCILV
mmetsp:Transcript_13179/g.15658  ORF Transcript_13179/g.15658 Transcript_13179/m.15658 type:complete len:95 (-) Transcript_13179:175-459(-)